MYRVISNPKRQSVNSGVVQFMIELLKREILDEMPPVHTSGMTSKHRASAVTI
jgi:hypothetical protein